MCVTHASAFAQIDVRSSNWPGAADDPSDDELTAGATHDQLFLKKRGDEKKSRRSDRQRARGVIEGMGVTAGKRGGIGGVVGGGLP